MKGCRLGAVGGGQDVLLGAGTASSEERRLPLPGGRACSAPAGIAFPLLAARVGLGGADRAALWAGLRVPTFPASLPPSLLPGGPQCQANEHQEEGAGSGALGAALLRRPGRGANAKFAPRVLASARVPRPRR